MAPEKMKPNEPAQKPIVHNDPCNQYNQLIGKTIKTWALHTDDNDIPTLDLTFTDQTKVYNLPENPHWVEFDAKGYPIISKQLVEKEGKI
jgi:hypothetical protein